MESNPKHGQPRLVIREMVLENFKSYAGAQRVGPFHKVSATVQTRFRDKINQIFGL